MQRRVVATLAVVALLSLAGCSALPVFGGPDASPTPTPTEATPDAGTPTATAEPITFPDGYGARGVTDAEAAIENHQTALAGYGSYRFRFDVAVGEDDQATDAFVYLLRADHGNQRALEIRDDGDATRFQYYTTDRLYLKLETGGNVSYNETAFQYVREELTGIQFVAPLVRNVEYSGPDVRETDNGTFYRFRSESVDDPGSILPAAVTDEEIASFDVTLVVHEDGSIRAASYRVVTEQDTQLSAVATVEGINETSVERPDWVDEAADG